MNQRRTSTRTDEQLLLAGSMKWICPAFDSDMVLSPRTLGMQTGRIPRGAPCAYGRSRSSLAAPSRWEAEPPDGELSCCLCPIAQDSRHTYAIAAALHGSPVKHVHVFRQASGQDLPQGAKIPTARVHQGNYEIEEGQTQSVGDSY